MPCYHLDERVDYHRDKNTTQITVRVQHTTGLLSRNRSGGGLSFTAVIHRTRNLLSVACIAFALLLLLQTDSFCFLVLCIESLLDLSYTEYWALYKAMKYPLASWPTSRLIGAVICSWLISAISLLLFYATAFPAIYIIVFCHTKFCFVSRRHMNQIKTQRLPSITKAKFLVERKALKTTSIIVGFICAKHFAQGNQIYWSPTQAVTLGVDRFVM